MAWLPYNLCIVTGAVRKKHTNRANDPLLQLHVISMCVFVCECLYCMSILVLFLL